MGSLLTDAQKSEIASVFDDIHDTFKRTITIYREGEAVLININDSNNSLYDRGLDSTRTTQSLEKYTTSARIKYYGEHGVEELSGDTGSNLEFPYGTIRLKIDETAYNLISSAKKIDVDGQLYRLRSGAARTGPFSAEYYVVYLQRGD